MIEIQIVQDWNSFGSKLYIFERVGKKIKFFHFENQRVVVIEKDDGNYPYSDEEIKPILLPYQMDRDLLQAFIKLAKKNGIKDSSESKAEGLYEATAKHLDDMRALLFKTMEVEKK